MNKSSQINKAYKSILLKEIVPAMGCTEPIAIAFASAKMREVLGSIPDKVTIKVSRNIIKNVKSVNIPNTNGLRGIKAAVAAGIVEGQSAKKLQVISQIGKDGEKNINKYLESHIIEVIPSQSEEIFEIEVIGAKEKETAEVRIVRDHTNIVYICKNDRVLYNVAEQGKSKCEDELYELLCLEDILEFALEEDLQEIEEVIRRQADYNYHIACEGLQGNYGSNIGKTILKYGNNDIRTFAKAMAAAGSDARMAGCELPVMIVGGSGNQGITASVPILAFSEYKNYEKQKVLRALVLSDLLSIYQRYLIGRLSAYCGAVNAASSAVAGIAYLEGLSKKQIIDSFLNTLLSVSGIVCDGAKASCAAKIAAAVEAGLLGYDMSREGSRFGDGEGINGRTAEETVRNIAILGREGMKETDRTIIEIMTQNI